MTVIHSCRRIDRNGPLNKGSLDFGFRLSIQSSLPLSYVFKLTSKSFKLPQTLRKSTTINENPSKSTLNTKIPQIPVQEFF